MRHADKLIQAVRERPFLYDQSLQTFRHLATKNRSWREVAKIVYGRDDKSTVSRVKIQWKSLRDAFVKQQRKRQSGTRKLRPYVYEAEMQFLLPHILMKERDDFSEEEPSNCGNFEVKTEDSVSLNASFSGDSQNGLLEPETPVIEEFLWNQQMPHKDNLEGKDIMHPVDAFFHGIAQTVKQLKPATIAKLKKAVANVVMDAEIQEIESENNDVDTYT